MDSSYYNGRIAQQIEHEMADTIVCISTIGPDHAVHLVWFILQAHHWVKRATFYLTKACVDFVLFIVSHTTQVVWNSLCYRKCILKIQLVLPQKCFSRTFYYEPSSSKFGFLFSKLNSRPDYCRQYQIIVAFSGVAKLITLK